MNRTEELIEKVNKYLTLMRYQYATQEQLSRQTIIKDYYDSKSEKSSTEKLSMKIEFAEQLGGDLILPLKVRGVFLMVGRPKVKYYTAEELEKAANNPVNSKFPIMLDHRDKEAGMIVGSVDKISYDPTKECLMWWGHINNETFARNVLDGLITDVSATIYSANEQDEKLGVVAKDLTFSELSLVRKGAAEGNYIEAY